MHRFGSLFSGVGGADMGLVAAGMVPVWACEIDRQARAVYRRHFPGVPIHHDIKELSGASLEPVDLLFFGSPCQDLSQAGGRAGLAGERSGLFHEAMRIVDEMAAPPRVAIWENVRGALSSNGGHDFAAVLTEMGRRWSGIAYRVLDLQYFGPPQRRERVFVVGHSGGWRSAAQILFEPEGVRWNPPARRKAGQAVAPTIRSGSSNGSPGHGQRSGDSRDELIVAQTHSSFGNAEYGAQLPALRAKGGDFGGGSEALVAFGGANTAGPVDVGTCQTGSSYRLDFESDTLIAHTLHGEGALASEDGTGRGTPLVTTLAIRGRGDRSSFEFRSDGTANTLLTPNGGRAGIGCGAICSRMAVRRLTPRECHRLMGWPDDWCAWGVDDAGKIIKMADGPQYKMIGNGVGKPHAEWLARRVLEVEAMEFDLATADDAGRGEGVSL